MNFKPLLIFLCVALLFWHPVFFTSHMPLMGDNFRQYYPWFLTLFRSLHAGTLPFWISEMGFGYPLLAQGETGSLYPLNWLLILLFRPETGFKLFFVIHYIVAGFGTYLFARSLKPMRISSVFSGLVFSYGFFFTARTIHPSIIASSSFLPFGFLVLENMITKKRLRYSWYLSFVVALQILSGHPQMTVISLTAYFFYICLRGFNFQRLLVVGLSSLLGLGIAGAQLLPTFELMQNSARNLNLDFIFSYSLPKSHFLTFLFPYLFGISPPINNSGFFQFGGHYWEFALYIGIFPLILALCAVLYSSHKQKKTLLLLLLIFSFLAVGGYTPIYRFVARLIHFPFRVSARFLIVQTFWLSVLSGIGLDYLLTQHQVKRMKAPLYFFCFVSLFIFIATFFATRFQNVFHFITAQFIFTEFQKIQLSDFSLVNPHIFVSFLFLSVSFGIVVLYIRNVFRLEVFVFLAFGLFFVDSFFQGFLYQQFLSQKEFLSPPSFLNNLSQNVRIFTFTDPGFPLLEKLMIQPNSNLIWNISSFNANTPLRLLNHDILEKKIRDNPQIAGNFGITHILSQVEISGFDTAKISDNPSVYLHYVENPQPRAFIENDPGAKVIQKLETDKKNIYEVTTETGGTFIFLNSHYPGWEVMVDGQKSNIFPVLHLFQGVSISKGHHVIKFSYVPKMFYLGMVVSTVSLIATTVLLKVQLKTWNV